MGKEQKAPYYDAIYAKSEAYKQHWSKSRYLKLWEAVIAELIPDCPIIDIGCGPGQFANMLAEKGFKNYAGVDFSREAISVATELNKKHADEFKFYVVDMFKEPFVCSDDTQFVIMETMEHVEKDVEFFVHLKENNLGKKVIITVPTFDDPAHVRHYKTANEWKERFELFITIQTTVTIGPWIIIIGEL